MNTGKVLVITGYSGSGKSSLARAIGQEAVCEVIEVGDIVRKAHRMANSPMALVDFANSTFRQFGPEVFLETAFFEQPVQRQCIVVGIRRPEELAWLKAEFDSASMIWIDADRGVRLDRVLARGSSDRAYFLRRDAIEEEWGLGQLRDMSDLVVSNEGALDESLGEIRSWLNSRSSAP